MAEPVAAGDAARANRRAFLMGALALSAAGPACRDDERNDGAPFGKGPRPPAGWVAPSSLARGAQKPAEAGATPPSPLLAIRAFSLPLDVEPPVMFRPSLGEASGRARGGAL